MFEFLKKENNINKLSKKLKNFYKLSESEFLKEVKKKNKKITNELILINKFNSIKLKISLLYDELEINNNKLNKNVYEIYKLNKDEINIIEKIINF